MLTGYIGDSFKSEQKSFEGYSFVNVEGQAEGIFSDQPQTIKYIYSKNPIKAKNVVVRYVDSKGNKIHDDNLIVGNIGDNYDASSASYKVAINGYTLDEEKLPLNIKGTFTNREQVVVYVYNKDNSQTTPSSSKPNNTPSNQGSTSKINTISLNHNSNSQGKVLPQTGENNKLSNILLSVGIFSLFILSLLQIVRLRRRN
ncbi:MucBP domain-containing protein [Lactococcus lactis]|uniref:MucBP domain-containing protein n=1 Tax=Lactococcus lactis TaxID=1358 RepID=UPI00240E6263|nr:MucBP domain-containing protein [Lactococcus lactis]WFB97023.1 MucBP domain-containing protein [Lactococcus lactis]